MPRTPQGIIKRMLPAFSREKYVRPNTMQLFVATAAIIKIRQYQATINIWYRRLESTCAIAESYQYLVPRNPFFQPGTAQMKLLTTIST